MNPNPSNAMQELKPFQLLPAIAFLVCGVALATPVKIRPAKCQNDGSCITVSTNHQCVDTEGDGICDYTEIYIQPR